MLGKSGIIQEKNSISFYFRNVNSSEEHKRKNIVLIDAIQVSGGGGSQILSHF